MDNTQKLLIFLNELSQQLVFVSSSLANNPCAEDCALDGASVTLHDLAIKVNDFKKASK